jgi:hypothetical protein
MRSVWAGDVDQRGDYGRLPVAGSGRVLRGVDVAFGVVVAPAVDVADAAVAVALGVGAGWDVVVNSASSKSADIGPDGRTMSLTRTEYALGGAWTGPVSSSAHVDAELTGLSSFLMAEPSPFLNAYQLRRTKTSPSPEAMRP